MTQWCLSFITVYTVTSVLRDHGGAVRMCRIEVSAPFLALRVLVVYLVHEAHSESTEDLYADFLSLEGVDVFVIVFGFTEPEVSPLVEQITYIKLSEF